MRTAERNRTVKATDMNERSSRSHTLMQLRILGHRARQVTAPPQRAASLVLCLDPVPCLQAKHALRRRIRRICPDFSLAWGGGWGGGRQSLRGSLNLVDLAGSERLDRCRRLATGPADATACAISLMHRRGGRRPAARLASSARLLVWHACSSSGMPVARLACVVHQPTAASDGQSSQRRGASEAPVAAGEYAAACSLIPQRRNQFSRLNMRWLAC